MYPLKYLRGWQPFRIDALGLVTLLGADEVNDSIGRLVRSKYFEYLPLLGAYIVASDNFTDRRSGFTLYNVSSGIVTPELSGWITRWLMAQEFKQACSIVKWEVMEPESTLSETLVALAIGVIIQVGFLIMTALMKDWWGFANAASMAVSTIVRSYVLGRNRAWLDDAVVRADEEGKKKGKEKGQDKEVKMIVITSDARAVIMEARECLIVPCFVQTPVPRIPDGKREGEPKIPSSKRVDSFNYPTKSKQTMVESNERTGETRTEGFLGPLHLYQYMRWLGWIAFGAHVISIGMSDLVSQLITVAIIVGPTFATVRRWCCDEHRIGSRLRAKVSYYPPEDPGRERRIDMYAYLELDKEETESMKQWDLIPRTVAKDFWEEWPHKQKLYHGLRTLSDDPETQRRTLEKRIRDRTRGCLQKDHTATSPNGPSSSSVHTPVETP